jgi:hypothetical protein
VNTSLFGMRDWIMRTFSGRAWALESAGRDASIPISGVILRSGTTVVVGLVQTVTPGMLN